MSAATTSRSNVVRPFFAFADLGECLNAVRLRAVEGENPTELAALKLAEDAFDDLAPRLHLDFERNAVLAALGERASRYRLLVTLRDTVRKRRWIHADFAIAEAPAFVDIDADLAKRTANRRSMEITVAIAAVSGTDPVPGHPRLKGGTIAQKRFTIKADIQQSTFNIHPWTPREFEEAGQPANSLLHVAEIADLTAPLEDGEPTAVVYVAEKVLKAVSGGKSSEALTQLLYRDILIAVILGGAGDIRDTERPDRNSPLVSLTDKLSLNPKMLRDVLLMEDECLAALQVMRLVENALPLVKELGALR